MERDIFLEQSDTQALAQYVSPKGVSSASFYKGKPSSIPDTSFGELGLQALVHTSKENIYRHLSTEGANSMGYGLQVCANKRTLPMARGLKIYGLQAKLRMERGRAQVGDIFMAEGPLPYSCPWILKLTWVQFQGIGTKHFRTHWSNMTQTSDIYLCLLEIITFSTPRTR